MQSTSATETPDAANPREAALREVLGLISLSRAEARPVFDAILRCAIDLCGADSAVLIMGRKGDTHQRLVVQSGREIAADAMYDQSDVPMDPGVSYAAETILTGRVLHIHDMMDTERYRSGQPLARFTVDDSGVRTVLLVPLLTATGAIGCIAITNAVVRPFTPDEIALAETFAAQAVIAIENAQQFRELQTRLEHEAATREILEIISRNPEDVQPVFEVIVRNAARLCETPDVGLHIVNDARTHIRLACISDASLGVFPVGQEFDLSGPHQTSTAIREGRVIHNPDIADDPLYRARDPVRVRLVEVDGVRSRLSVPLMKNGVAFGCINLNRHEVRPFTPGDIALIETFAAQAVIAIENARQFHELQTRLAREAATREILEVISKSRDDDRPVFDAMLRSAQALCGADAAALLLGRADGPHLTLAALQQDNLAKAEINAFIAAANQPPMLMDPGLHVSSQAICSGKIVHIADLAQTKAYLSGETTFRFMVEDQGLRTTLSVPLFDRHGAIGAISMHRREVKLFSADEVALIQSFAAQAVIAIENVRQFRELQARLAREKASAEILEVISQSRDDDQPVFDVVLRKAAELCHAPMASLLIISEDRSHAVLAADWGHHDVSGFIRVGETVWPLDSDLAAPISMREGRIVHLEDLADSDLYRSGDPLRTAAVDQDGIRTLLAVPLFSGGRTVGCIYVYRREVCPFTADEITLVETFAAQAVIAIENVRQFRELEDSLEKQEATSDILRVISQSREDEAQVFDLVVEKATVLCDADQGSLHIVNEARTHVRLMADWGHDRTAWRPGLEISLDRPLSIVPTIRTGKVVHIEDYAQSDAYRDRDPIAVDLVEIEGVRTRLNVPLLQNGIAIGCISLSRRAVRPFTLPEIALVETFAAQAVIAIENVRQFRELQARLAREAATREILEVISHSRDDDAPVFDAVLRNANRLCGTSMAYLMLGRPDDTHMTMAAYVNPYLPSQDSVDQIIAFANQTGMRMDAPEHFSAQAILSGEVVQIADLATTHGYLSGEPTVRILVEDVGVRTILSVPLFDAQGTIGAISLQRREERLFSDDEIALIQSFAAQAVIAIENVRQFRELQTRLEREKATREILGVISQSRDDDQPVFECIVQNAARLLDSAAGVGLHLLNEARTHSRFVCTCGLDSSALFPLGTEFALNADLPMSVAMREVRPVQVPDVRQSALYLAGDPDMIRKADGEGVSTFVSVPLVRDGVAIGFLNLNRLEVKPYTDAEIALAETFAAQAVIAIENVRQFRELQTRLEREKATRDILQVISQSREDNTPVFDMIAQSAARLCHAAICTFWRIENGMIHYCASHGLDGDAFAETQLAPAIPLLDNTLTGQVVKTRAVTRIEDPMAESYHDHDWARARGVTQMIGVPIFAGDEVWGCICLLWRADQAPRDADIQLVESFAAQASIAIENVRQFRELQTRLEREAATREILSVISQSRDDDRPVFEMIAESAARLCHAANCTFWRVENGLVHYCASYGFSRADFEDDVLTPISPISPLQDNTLIGQAVKTRSVARIEDGTADSYLNHDWVRAHGLRYLIGVPIFVGDDVWGSINLMWMPDQAPRDEDIRLVESFAAQASIAIENVRQFRALETLNAELGDRVQEQVGEIERMGRLKRFLPTAVADAVVSSGSERLLSSHRALLGVLFCDIRGFTAFCETAEPEETIEVLQTYHEEMGRLINDHGAGVDHRMGDGIMVLFNDPLPCDDPAGTAVRLAMAMRDRMAELCARWKKMGHRLGFGVGISLGYATVGMVGSGGRQDYTASGTAVNLAARLCDEALDGEILVSPRARTAVEGSYVVEGRGERTLKGIREPVELCRVTGVVA